MDYKFVKTVGVFDTRNFEFTVCGDSRYNCCNTLRKAWKVHRSQYNIKDRSWLDELIDGDNLEDNIRWFDDVKSGQVYRDAEIIYERT
jgi:hypothetical protein